jgi:hypothetical protein
MMNRFRSFGVLYHRVVTPPPAVGQFMELHFNLDTFVAALNHSTLLSGRKLLPLGSSSYRLTNWSEPGSGLFEDL